MCGRFVLLLAAACVVSVAANADVDADIKQKIARAEVQSCGGCTLNRKPQVKAFVYEDLPKYAGVDFKKIPGADPELVLFDEKQQEVKRIGLKDKSREECNTLLKDWGYKMAASPSGDL